MTQLIISVIPILIVTILLYIKKIKINDVVNIIFWGCISVIITIILYAIVHVDTKEYSGLIRFIIIFIFVALVEEIAKYIAIKASKPTNKKEIFVNSIYISLIFVILENYGYAGDTNNILKLGIYRILTPLHMIFQIAMAYFLNKAYCNRKENKKQDRKKFPAFC